MANQSILWWSVSWFFVAEAVLCCYRRGCAVSAVQTNTLPESCKQKELWMDDVSNSSIMSACPARHAMGLTPKFRSLATCEC